MKCSRCSAELTADDRFCGECGQRVDPDPSTPPVRPQTAPGDSWTHNGSADPGPGAPALDHDSELEGQATPNPHYVGIRLGFREGEVESLDPINVRFLKALQVQWSIIATLAFCGSCLLALFWGLILGSPKLAVIAVVIWLLAMGVAAWWLPVFVSVSEWKFMVDGKAVSSEDAFEHIKWAFLRRKSPVDDLRIHRLSLGGTASRDYLYVQDDVFRAYIACFPYGRDLYVGWTLWWRLSAVRWLWTLLKRNYQAYTLRGSELHTVHRYDIAKALREAVHGAAREGLDAATGVVAFRSTGTAGSGIKVEKVGYGRPQASFPGLGSTPA